MSNPYHNLIDFVILYRYNPICQPSPESSRGGSLVEAMVFHDTWLDLYREEGVGAVKECLRIETFYGQDNLDLLDDLTSVRMFINYLDQQGAN